MGRNNEVSILIGHSFIWFRQPGVEIVGFESGINQNELETRSLGGKTEATTDEELAAYEDRRNGIGAHFVPMVMQAKQQQMDHQNQHNIGLKIIHAENGPIEDDSGNARFSSIKFFF